MHSHDHGHRLARQFFFFFFTKNILGRFGAGAGGHAIHSGCSVCTQFNTVMPTQTERHAAQRATHRVFLQSAGGPETD